MLAIRGEKHRIRICACLQDTSVQLLRGTCCFKAPVTASCCSPWWQRFGWDGREKTLECFAPADVYNHGRVATTFGVPALVSFLLLFFFLFTFSCVARSRVLYRTLDYSSEDQCRCLYTGAFVNTNVSVEQRGNTQVSEKRSLLHKHRKENGARSPSNKGFHNGNHFLEEYKQTALANTTHRRFMKRCLVSDVVPASAMLAEKLRVTSEP